MEHSSFSIQSPFVTEAFQCSSAKKKVSKRIKKIANSIYKNKNQETKASRDSDQSKIVSILQDRNVPDFLVDFVKKKRIFNLSSLRKIQLGKPSEDDLAFTPTTDYMLRQEQELADILAHNREWREQRDLKRKSTALVTPMTRKTSAETKEDIYSEEEYSEMSYNNGFSAVIGEESSENVSMFSLMNESVNLMKSRTLEDASLFMRMY